MERSGPGVTSPDRGAGTLSADADAGDASRAAGGDRRAFERLYQRHQARIHSLARRMMGAGEADEVTQDVFVRAWQKLDTFRGEAAFGTWLYRVAINVALARRQQLGTQRRRIDPDETALDQIAVPPRHSDLGLDFERAIERLPEGARQVFVLHDVEGFRHQEIGNMMGVTSGTSKAQLHRARMILRRFLSRS